MDTTTMAASQEDTYVGESGLRIFYRSWRPEGPPKAVVVLCHGFNSHSGQYGWPAEQLTSAGYVVYAGDLRGRGKSEGERSYGEHVNEYVDDLAGVIQIAKAREAGLPAFLFGHSAGGVVSATYALDQQAELAGFICEDFAFQVPAPGFVLSAIKGLSHIAPRLGVLKLKNSEFSRDPQVVAALDQDPLIADETQSAMTVAALVRADERLREEFPSLRLPLLIIHGTSDHITVPDGSRFFYDSAGSTDKTLKLYEGHYHDPLHDIGREEVMADIKDWLQRHLPA